MNLYKLKWEIGGTSYSGCVWDDQKDKEIQIIRGNYYKTRKKININGLAVFQNPVILRDCYKGQTIPYTLILQT